MACHLPVGNMGITARPVIHRIRLQHCRNTEDSISMLERLLQMMEVSASRRCPLVRIFLRLETSHVMLGGLASLYETTSS